MSNDEIWSADYVAACKEIDRLRTENAALITSLARQTARLAEALSASLAAQIERDTLRELVREMLRVTDSQAIRMVDPVSQHWLNGWIERAEKALATGPFHPPEA
jgi:hypothetical protein